ncbi:PREDICTED: kelch-like protein 33 [Gekko japonicus]|uniref:Kelch-like protein 33 n=1 Tax=Gekko japonicus TaxID=146911 RepID=A0ABM1KIJ9_GEKJA|nr:PREDICTED: kelch-like protein 33 [Gekko japonicus]
MSCGGKKPPEDAEGYTAEQRWELRSEGHAEGFFMTACQLREQRHLLDVTVTLGPSSYEAHGIILAAVSSVFRQRLERGEQEVLELDGVTTAHGWEAILNFAYTGQLEVMPETAGELLDAAEALGVPRVAEICKAVLIEAEPEERPSPSKEKWETLRKVEELYKEGVGCDLALKAEGHTYQVHRLALACGSEFFHAMFTSGMKESRQEDTPLCTRFTLTDLGLVVSFAYSGVVAGGWDDLFDAAQAALQYQVSGIWALCLDVFRHELCPESSFDVLSFARAYGLHELENTASDYVLRNFVRISATPKFLDLPVNQLVDILSSDALYVLNELEAFQGALRWLDADRDGRMDRAETVMRCIRFPLMSTRELKQVRVVDMMAAPGRLYDLLVESLSSLPPGPSKMEQLPCRVRYPEKVIVISGGDCLSKNMATRNPSEDIWISHRFVSSIGLVKQIEWRHLGVLPEGPRFQHAVAVKDNVMYILGGKHYYGTGDSMRSVFKFDPFCGRWERLADMTSFRSYFPAVFQDGLLYALGGSSRDAYCFNSAECYDPHTNAWRSCEPLPSAVCGHAACVLDGSIYISGGSDGSCRCLSVLIQYRPGGPAIPRASMIEERAGHIMEALDRRLYVAGGLRWRDGHGGYADQLACEVYNLGQDTWAAFTPLPQAHVIAASTVLHEELYILGGYSHNTYRDTHLIHCYNPNYDRWVSVGTLPQAYADLRACILEVPSSLRAKQLPPSNTTMLEIPDDPSTESADQLS